MSSLLLSLRFRLPARGRRPGQALPESRSGISKFIVPVELVVLVVLIIERTEDVHRRRRTALSEGQSAEPSEEAQWAAGQFAEHRDLLLDPRDEARVFG